MVLVMKVMLPYLKLDAPMLTAAIEYSSAHSHGMSTMVNFPRKTSPSFSGSEHFHNCRAFSIISDMW